MTEHAKKEIQDEARELLRKCRRLMTPGVIATLENLLSPEDWNWSGDSGWYLWDDEAEEKLREIRVLYFNDLIAPRPVPGLRYSR